MGNGSMDVSCQEGARGKRSSSRILPGKGSARRSVPRLVCICRRRTGGGGNLLARATPYRELRGVRLPLHRRSRTPALFLRRIERARQQASRQSYVRCSPTMGPVRPVHYPRLDDQQPGGVECLHPRDGLSLSHRARPLQERCRQAGSHVRLPGPTWPVTAASQRPPHLMDPP